MERGIGYVVAEMMRTPTIENDLRSSKALLLGALVGLTIYGCFVAVVMTSAN